MLNMHGVGKLEKSQGYVFKCAEKNVILMFRAVVQIRPPRPNLKNNIYEYSKPKIH